MIPFLAGHIILIITESDSFDNMFGRHILLKSAIFKMLRYRYLRCDEHIFCKYFVPIGEIIKSSGCCKCDCALASSTVLNGEDGEEVCTLLYKNQFSFSYAFMRSSTDFSNPICVLAKDEAIPLS